MAVIRSYKWWSVCCTRRGCRWANTRAGSQADVTKNSCPRCGGKVAAVPTYGGFADTGDRRHYA